MPDHKLSPERLNADLQWSLNSPPLIAESDDFWPGQNWFDQLTVPPDHDTADPDIFRLGIRFERFIQAWLTSDPDRTLLAANLPVRGPAHTVGEFDLIVQHKQIEHWELAVKFYLGTGSQKSLYEWYGPDPSDSFGDKYDRLMTHQMQLSGYPEAQAMLAERGWQVERIRGFVKGRLFYPYEAFIRDSFVYPDTVNDQHEKGWWLTDDAFNALTAFRDAAFVILDKRYWLAPISSDDLVSIVSANAVIEALHDSTRGPTLQVARVDEYGAEISRGFVVTEQWLARLSHP